MNRSALRTAALSGPCAPASAAPSPSPAVIVASMIHRLLMKPP
jgi:hypothetical protein